MTAFIHTGTEWHAVPSLRPHLTQSLTVGATLDPRVLRPEDEAMCRWSGYGIAHGATHPDRRVNALVLPPAQPTPPDERGDAHRSADANELRARCSSGAIRWTFFTDPRGGPGVFGCHVDPNAPADSDVATTMLAVADVVRAAHEAGIPEDAEVALLHPWPIEATVRLALRNTLGLMTVGDWNARAHEHFGPRGSACPRCAHRTRQPGVRACTRCGCTFSLVAWTHLRDRLAAAAA